MIGRGMSAVLITMLVSCGGAPPPEPAPGDPLAEVSAAELFVRGTELRQAGDFVRAEQYFVAARDKGHNEGEIIGSLIGVSIDAARYQAALRYALPYLERHPDDWALRYLVGSLHLATGDAQRARAQLERAITSRPDEPGPHYLLAITIAEKFAQPEAAQAEFRAYLELAPDGRHAAEAREWLSGVGKARPLEKPRSWQEIKPGAAEGQP